MWTNSLRTAIFTVVMIGYLTQRDLISLQRVSDIFGCKGSFQVLAFLVPNDFLCSQSRMD